MDAIVLSSPTDPLIIPLFEPGVGLMLTGLGTNDAIIELAKLVVQKLPRKNVWSTGTKNNMGIIIHLVEPFNFYVNTLR